MRFSSDYRLEMLEARVLLSAEPMTALEPVSDLTLSTDVVVSDSFSDTVPAAANESLFDGIETQSIVVANQVTAGVDESDDITSEQNPSNPLAAETLPLEQATPAIQIPSEDPIFSTGDSQPILPAALIPTDIRGPPLPSLTGDAPAHSLTDIVLAADVYTNGDNKLFEGNVVIAAGKSVIISTGPLGGNIFIEGNINGTADPNGFLESLTIIGGTGDIIIRGDIGNSTPLQNLTIVSAGRVVVNGNIQITGQFVIQNTSGNISLGIPQIEGGAVGNVIAGSVNISTDAEVTFHGALTTVGGSQSIVFSARPLTGTGDITVNGNLTTDGPLTITTARNVRFLNPVSVAGDFRQFNGMGTTTFDRQVAARSFDLTTSSLIFNDRASVAANHDFVLSADEIDFNGGAATVTSGGVDTSLIILRPTQAVIPVKVGTAAGANVGVLDLSVNDLNAISDKFSAVIIGWEGAPDSPAALQRWAMTTVTAGGSDLSAARVEIRSPGLDNDLLFTANTPGAAMNDIVVRIFDDATMPLGTAEARYYPAQRLLAINVRLFSTTASAVLDAVNLHTKLENTNTEFGVGDRPFTASAGSDFTSGLGLFETVISAKTTQGADALQTTGVLLVPGEDNDLLLTARTAGANNNSTTIALLNRDVPDVTVIYSSGPKVLTITARLVDGPNGNAHTRADIIAAINAANIPFTAAPAATDTGTTGLLELGRTDLVNPAQFHSASIRINNNVTAPQSISLSAWAGGITTPVTGVVATGILSAFATGPIQLNTNVTSLSAHARANGDISIGEADSLTVSAASTASGSIYIVTAIGDLTLAVGPGITAGEAGNIALQAAAAIHQQSNIQTAGGSVSLESVTAGITMSSTAATTSNNGNIRYASIGPILLNVLNAGSGRISLISTNGPLTDANADALNLISSQLRLTTGSTVGTPTDALEISTGTMAGTASTGFFIKESDDLTVGSVSVTVQIVNSNLSAATHTDATLNGLTTQAGGHLVLTSILGSITVNQPVTLGAGGNLLFAAQAANQNISLNAAITTETGHQSLLAGLNINQNSGGNIFTGGGTVDLQAGGAITMQNGVTTTTSSANIRYQASGQIALSALNAGTAHVSVLSAAGAIVDAGDNHPEITATQTRLSALASLGAGNNHLELAVATLAATSLNNGVFITNTGALTVDQVGPITVNRVATDGTTPAGLLQTDPALSDVLAPMGPVILITQNGALTINAGTDANGVIAAGNVLLQTQGTAQDLTVNALVRSNVAHVTLTAAGNLLLSVDGDILTPNGDVLLQAQAGSITMDDGTMISAMGNIAASATNDVLVGGMLTLLNTISVVAGGAILDNGDSSLEFVAANLRLQAGTGIGNGANLVDTGVPLLAATAGGGLFLSNNSSLIIGTMPAVTVTTVQPDATQQIVTHAPTLSGVTTTAANGRLVVQTVNGTLTVNQPVSSHGSGNLLLLAQTTGDADKDLLLNSSVSSTSGRVSVVANRHILQAATAPIVTGGAGTVDVEAETGRIEMSNGALTQTSGGTIRYAAAANVLLGGLDAGAGDVSVVSTSGSILDNGDTHVEVRAANLRFSAGTAIGQSINPLELQVNNLAARAANGGIFILETDALTVALVGPVNSYRVRAAGTSTLLTDPAMTGVTTTGGNGPIVLRTLNGTLTLQQTVTTHGTGNILLEAAGTTADINLSAPVVTPSGNLTLLAARDVSQQAAGDLSALGGTLDVEAASGSITMADGALSQTGGGHIRYIASNDLTIGGLAAGTGTISLTAGRAILDAGDTNIEITAASARLIAGAAIGLPADALESAVNTLAAQAGGGIFLNDTDDLIIGTVSGIQVSRVSPDSTTTLHPSVVPAALTGITTAGGDYPIIVWTLNGTLTINNAINASGQGNILLRTQSGVVNDKDIILNSPVTSAAGHLSIVANRNVTQSVTGTLTVAGSGTISVEALNGSITMADNGTSSATATTAGGNLRYKAAQNIFLGSLNAASGNISVQAVSGSITDAGDSLADLSAAQIRLVAGTAIGATANALEIAADVVAARAASGGIFLSETNAVTINTVGQVPARRVQTDASTTTDQDTASLSGLVTAANNGPIAFVAAGSVNVQQPITAHGTGNILLRAGALTGNHDLSLAAAISTTAGHISMLAAHDINQTATAMLTTAGGTVDAQAFTGSITMTNGAVTTTSGGAIRYAAAVNIALAGLNSGNAPISLIATTGAITDAGDTHLEISAAQARLVAGAGIGQPNNHLETSITTLTASTAAGGLFILNSGNLTVDTVQPITVNRVDTDGTAPLALRQTDAARSDIISVGGAVLRTISGSITINDGSQPADAIGITITSGNLLLQAQGTGADIQLNASANVSGSVSIIATRHLNQAASGHIISSTGTVDVMAQGGSLTMTDGARTESINKNIRLWAAQNIVLSGINAGSGAVSITARDAAITDSGDSRTDITAASGRLVAGTGIATGSNHLETSLNTLAALANSAGIFITNNANLTVDNVGPVTVDRVDTDATLPAQLRLVDSAMSDITTAGGNGSIVLRTLNGTLTINDGNNPADATGIRAHGTGNIRLEAGSTEPTDKNVNLNAAVRSTSGRITILANASVVQSPLGDLLTGAASIEVQAFSGAIHMADGAVAQTTGATIRYQAATDILLGGLLNGNGDISILAGGSIQDGGNANPDVQAARLRLIAGIAAGAGGDPLDTEITTLAARAGNGGFFLTDADALTVDALGLMTVSRVDTDGTTPLALRINDAALAEVRTTGGGTIVLTAANGQLTINQSVGAAGAGNIRLAAFSADLDVMDVLVNALVESESGHITIFANRDVRQSAVGSITTTGGAVSVDASTGSIIMENGALTASGGGNIRYFAAGDVRIGGLRADTGAVSVTAATGRILDNGDFHKDILAAALRMVGAAGIGQSTNALDLSVNTIAARAAAGGIFLLEDDAISVDTVAPIITQRVTANGTTPAPARITDNALSDLVTTGGNAPVILQTLNGSITIRDGSNPANGTGVSAHGSGNVLIEAQSSSTDDKDVHLFAAVTSATGSISILANQNIIQETAGSLRTGGAGTIEVEARRGNLTMFGNAVAQTAGGNIRYKAALDVTLTTLNAGTGDVSILATGGSILDGDDIEVEIIANRLRLAAGNGIGILGLSANALETRVATLSARAEAGGINLVEADALVIDDVTVTVSRVTANANLVPITDSVQSDLTTYSGDGSIVLSTLAGSLTLNPGSSPADSAAVRAHGLGNVRLNAGGAGSDLVLNAGVYSTQGHLTLLAARHVTLAQAVEVRTAAGAVVVEASAGSLTMHDTAFIQSASGAIRLTAANDLILGAVSTTGNVSLIAATGSILDGGDTYTDVTAAALRLSAGVGVGVLGANANALETQVNTVTARASGGGINLVETDALVIGSVSVTYQLVQNNASISSLTDAAQSDLRTTSGNGSIVVRTLAGTLTLNDGLAPADGVAISAHGSGNVLLTAAGADADLLLNASVQSGTGAMTLRASRDIIFALDVVATTQGPINLQAGRNLQMAGRNRLDAGNGNIRILAETNATVSGLSTTGNVSIIALNGSILDADDTRSDISANSLRMVAAVSIGTLGTNANPLETNVSTVTARSGAGGVSLLEADALSISGVSVTITEVQENGTLNTITDPLQSDVLATNAGPIVIRTVAGSLTLQDGTAPADNVAVSTLGNILLSAGGAGSALNINADVLSSSTTVGGHVSLSARSINLGSNVSVWAGVNGTLNAAADAGDLTMSSTSRFAAGGDIRVIASNNIVLGLVVTPVANVAITATNGSITDAGVTQPFSQVNIASQQLRLAAGVGIGVLGTNAAPLRTAVSIVSARATSGGINLLESDAIMVDDTAATVQVVAADATVSALAETRQNDLQTTSGNGAIVLRTLAGGITLNEGTPSNLQAVNAHGTGNILLAAGGTTSNLTANSDVRSLNGHVTVQATGAVTFNALADIITGGNGTIYVEAAGGSVTMSANSQFFNGLGAIRILANNDVILGNLTTLNNVSVIATNGSILDGSASFPNNIFADGARLVAAGGIGTLGVNHDPLETTIATLTARAGSGGVNLTEANNLRVAAVEVTVSRVLENAAVLSVTDASMSDVITTANGSIRLATETGSITLNEGDVTNNQSIRAAGSGTILLQAGGNAGDVQANASVLSDTGHVTILAGRTINIAAQVRISTAGNGTLNLEAATGSLSMNATAGITAGAGDIRVLAAQNVALGLLSTSGNVAITATTGSITDIGTSPYNVVAGQLRLVAGNGIGTPSSPLRTQIAQASARATAGGIFLLEADDLTITQTSATIQKVQADATVLSVTEASQHGTLTTAGNGRVILRTTAGSLTLTARQANPAAPTVGADGAGNVLLAAGGASSRIVLLDDALAQSGTGHLTMIAGQGIVMAANSAVTTSGTGTISLEASGGNIQMERDATITGASGAIRLAAASGVVLGTLSTTGNVSIIANSGSITDAGVTTVNVLANQLRLVASVGVGQINPTANPLKTTVAVASARGGGAGINLLETDALVIGDTAATVQVVQADGGVQALTDTTQSDLITTSGNGAILVRTIAGTLTLTDGTAGLADTAVNADGSGNIALRAGGAASDVTAQANVTSGTGHITVVAGRSVQMNAAVNLQTGGAGSVYVEALSGGITLNDTARITANTGHIRLAATQNIVIGGILTQTNVSLLAGGSILDGGDTLMDVAADTLRMVAGSGIGTLGTPADALETTVTYFSARAGGSIHVVETDTLNVDDAYAAVQLVLSDGTLERVEDASQSDVVTTANNGSIVLRTLAGSLALNDGLTPNDISVQAHGSGNILLEAGGFNYNVDLMADVRSGTGHITIIGGRDVTLAGASDVLTGSTGNIVVEATAGSILMNDNTRMETGSGAIRLTAAMDITLSGIRTTGNASLIASTGSILDGGDTYTNVTAAALRLSAGVGVGVLGSNANALETQVNTVSARAAAGGINLVETDALVIETVTVTYQLVQNDASITTLTDASQSDLITLSGNGSIVVVTQAGGITLNDGLVDQLSVAAHGLGNVLLQAAGSIRANADVAGSGGHLTLMASGDVVFSQGADLRTSGSASINVQTSTGSLTMSDDSLFTTGSGHIKLMAPGNVLVGGILTTGNVSITSANGSVLDAGDRYVDVVASGLRISAAISVGTLGATANALEITVNTVAASAGTGGINMFETNAIVVNDASTLVHVVQTDATTQPVGEAVLSDLVTTGSGSLVLVTANGSITLNDGDDMPDGASVTAGGHVLLQAGGADIIVNASVTSAGGHVTATAGRDIRMAPFASMTTSGAGSLNVQALTGSLVMDPRSSISSQTGNLRLTAANDAILTAISTQGNVAVTASNGSILDAGDQAFDLVSSSIRLKAGSGVGLLAATPNALEIQAAALTAQAGNLGINILERDSITISSVAVTVQSVTSAALLQTITEAPQSDLTSTGGSIVLRTLAGTITLLDGTPSPNGQAVTVRGSGNILLWADGTTSNLDIQSSIVAEQGSISLIANRGISLAPSIQIITTTGTVDLEAATGDLIMGQGALIQTNGANVRLMSGGEVLVSRLDARTAADRANNTITQQSAWGAISISAANSLREAGVLPAGVATVYANALRLAAGQTVGGFLAPAPVTYRLQTTSNLITWTDLTTITSAEGQFQFTDTPPPSTGMRFYRILTSDPTVAAVMAPPTIRQDGSVTLAWQRRDTNGLNGALHVEAATLAVNAGAGGLQVVEATGVTVDTVSVTVNRVATNGLAAPAPAATGSDLKTSGQGAVVLRTLAGHLILEPGGTDNLAVSAVGGGNILLTAEGPNTDVIVRADIQSLGGHVTLTAQRHLTLAAQADVVVSGNASINLEAATGDIAMNENSRVRSDSGHLRIHAGMNLVLTGIRTAGHVAITAVQGGITNAGDVETDLVAGALRINSALGIGGSTSNLDIQTTVLSVSAGRAVFLRQTGVLTVSDVAVTVQKVLSTGGTTPVVEQTQSGITTTAQNGSVILRVLQGDLNLEAGSAAGGIAVNAHGSGNIRLETDANLNANAHIQTSTGHITLLAGQTITLAASVKVQTTAASSLYLRAANGSLRMADSAALLTNTGNIHLEAAQNVILGLVDARFAADRTASTLTTQAGWGSVSILAGGAILEASSAATTTIKVFASTLQLAAGASIGSFDTHTYRVQFTSNFTTWNTLATLTSNSPALTYTDSAPSGMRFYRILAQDGVEIPLSSTILDGGAVHLDWQRPYGLNPLEIETRLITAAAGAPGINLAEQSTLTVDTVTVPYNQVLSDGTTSLVAGTASSDLVVSGAGALVMRTLNGTLNLNDGANANGVAVSSGGHVLLASGGSSSDIQFNASVRSTAGSISLHAGRSLTLAAGVAVETSSLGTLDLDAQTGSLTMNPGSRLQTDGGNIRIRAQNNVTLALVDARTPADRTAGTRSAQSSWGAISVQSLSGAIQEADTTAAKTVDLFGSSARLSAGISVGQQTPSANPMETELITIAISTGNGGLNILDLTALSVGVIAPVQVNRVGSDGVTVQIADAVPLSGAVKSGGLATILSDQQIPIGNYPDFAVLNVVDINSFPNSLTGLYHQTIRISNPTGSTIDSVRIYIRNLPANTRVPYANGIENGLPYVQYNLPLAAGESRQVTIEYLVPTVNDLPTNVTFYPVVTAPLPAINLTSATLVDFGFTRQGDGRYSLIFETQVGRDYYIQYSDDNINWKTVLVPVRGTGSVAFWYDVGPTKTYPDPAGVETRFYRVLRV